MVVSPMPGTVIRVEVTPGDAVRARQPLVVLEAMKMEIPVHSPFDGSVTAVLVAPGDAEGIAQALIGLLGDADERRRLGSQLRERIDAEYSAAAVLSRWERVYRSALARRAAIDAR